MLFIPYFLPEIIELNGMKRYLPEDFVFCYRAAKAGYKIWCDTSISLWHVGRYGFSFRDMNQNVQAFFNEDIRNQSHGTPTI